MKLNNQQGFSLIEILVALIVVAMAMGAFLDNPFGASERDKLNASIQRIQRVIKLAQDESILQNKIARVKFEKSEDDDSKVTLSIELATTSELLLVEKIDTSKMDRKEFEAYQEKIKEQSSSFSVIEEEIDPKDLLIDSPINFLGVGLGESEELIQDLIEIYFFPSGEKDMATIYLATNQEIAEIAIESFKIHSDYKYITSIYNSEENPNKNNYEFQLERAQKVFKVWRKNL